MDSAISFPITYPLDSDLSGGLRYPTFEQPGPGKHYFGGQVRVMWHGCGLVRATWRLDSHLCFVALTEEIEFRNDQCSHGQMAFCSCVLGQKSNLLKKNE